jgi:hypothetical protein
LKSYNSCILRHQHQNPNRKSHRSKLSFHQIMWMKMHLNHNHYIYLNQSKYYILELLGYKPNTTTKTSLEVQLTTLYWWATSPTCNKRFHYSCRQA